MTTEKTSHGVITLFWRWDDVNMALKRGAGVPGKLKEEIEGGGMMDVLLRNSLLSTGKQFKISEVQKFFSIDHVEKA